MATVDETLDFLVMRSKDFHVEKQVARACKMLRVEVPDIEEFWKDFGDKAGRAFIVIRVRTTLRRIGFPPNHLLEGNLFLTRVTGYVREAFIE